MNSKEPFTKRSFNSDPQTEAKLDLLQKRDYRKTLSEIIRQAILDAKL